jgi:hypothetical protein
MSILNTPFSFFVSYEIHFLNGSSLDKHYILKPDWRLTIGFRGYRKGINSLLIDDIDNLMI